MEVAIEQFRANIERVRNLGSLTIILSAQTIRALDLSDILRAELVLAVSSLDNFVHEIVRLGMLDAYKGNRHLTQAFLRFQVSMDNVLQSIANPVGDDWLEREIRNHHSYRSFQTPDNIADAIRLISDVQLWNTVASHTGLDSQGIRERLNLIVNHRNQIAHEADTNPSYPLMRWPIDEQMVDYVVDFIEQIVEAIYETVS